MTELRAVSEHSFARAWQTVAELAPDRAAIVCGERRLSFAEFDARANRLGHVLAEAGLAPGDKVAIMCLNGPEYLEAFYGAQKIGCVPVNVNYRYVGAELAYLLDNSDAAALVYHDDFAATVADALGLDPESKEVCTPGPNPSLVLLQVAHGGTTVLLDNGRDYESALAAASPEPPTAREPSGDDVIFLYTGGTTGFPKAVMWRSDDLYVALWQDRGHVSAGVPAHARNGLVHHAVDARRRRGGRPPRQFPPRCGARLGRR